jgi:photosystem II stability/assembly factor-like uncharacterized protein
MRRAACAVLLAAVSSVACLGYQYLINDTGEPAYGLRVVFSQAVQIKSFGDVFTEVAPGGSSGGFLFSGGRVESWTGGHWLSWSPAAATISNYEWISDADPVSSFELMNEPPWEQTGGPTGAPMDSVAMHPGNPSILYASGIGGGVYRTFDGGESWQLRAIDDSPAHVRIHSLTINPKEPNIIHAASVGGVLRSTDNGDTWHRKNRGIDSCHLNIRVLALDPVNPNEIYVGTGSHCPNTSPGAIYRSTDNGETWSNISAGLGMRIYTGVEALDVLDRKIYVGLRDHRGEECGHLFHSLDAGRIWTRVDFGQPDATYIYSVFIDHKDPNEVWVGLDDYYSVGVTPSLFVTRDGGKSWAGVGSFPMPGEVIILGKAASGDVYVNNYRSSDRGRTWIRYVEGFLADDGDFPGVLVFDPEDEMVIYAAPCFGAGIVHTTDGGRTWERRNNGILNTAISLIASCPSDPSIVLASAVSGEGTFFSQDSGFTWEWVTGNGITHPWADELTFRKAVPGEVWEVADVGQVFVSKDSGRTWSRTIDTRVGGQGFRFGSIYALASAPSDPDVIYALKNGFGLYRSRDGGQNWTFLRTSEVDYSYSIAVHPDDPNTVITGFLPKPFQDFGMVRRTVDGGATWDTVLTVPESLGITSVAIDPSQPSTAYAASVGQRGSLFKSEDEGASWNQLNDRFTMLTVWGQPQLVTDPRDSSVVYVTTWLGGTWKSVDSGRNWTLLAEAPISGTSLCVNPLNSEEILASDRTRPVVWRSSDGGQTWLVVADFGEDGAFLVNRVLTDGERIYAATFEVVGHAHGGRLYVSENAGSTWEDITGELPRSVLDIALDPTSLGTVYVTTHIHGAFKSVDGGMSWVEMMGFPDIGAYDIEVDPDDPMTLYACGMGGEVPAWTMPPNGYAFEDPSGVYKSVDAGITWTRILETSNECRAIRVHPNNSDLLFAAAMDDGLLISRDGGDTWSSVNEGLDTTVLTSVDVRHDRVYVGTQGFGVYSGDLVDGELGVIWRPERSNKPIPEVHSIQLQVDPSDSSRLFVGANPGGLFRSDDGGRTFYDKNFLTPSVVVTDPHRQGYYNVTLSPTEPDQVWLGTWGLGIYKSYDGMDFGAPASGRDGAMFGKHVHEILVDPRSPNTVYVATEEGVFRTVDAGASWSDYSAGLESLQVRTLSMTSQGVLLGGTLGYEVYSINTRLPDSLARWRQLQAFDQFGNIWPIWDDRPLYQYSTLLFHPTEPNIVYFGTFPAGIYASADGGQSWRESNPGWPNDGVFSLMFHPDDTDIIFAGTYNGVMVSHDAGAHWRTQDTGWPDEQWVFSMAFDPRDSDVVYACSKNGENEGRGREEFHGTVMKSTNGGMQWREITSGLDLDQEFYKILVDPTSPDIIYLATQYDGVFISRNGGASWSSWNDGLMNPVAGTNGNNVTNTMVFSSDGKWVFFGTAGSGVFRRQTIGSLER